MERTTTWLTGAVRGTLVGTEVSVAGSVQTDSRECVPGSVYVARRGEQADGHNFASDAVANGAVCVICERELDVPITQILVPDATIALGDLARAHLEDLRASGEITVAGITGSAGKTTTKDLLGQILSSVAPTVRPVASFNNEVGCPLTILRADHGTRFLVLEMGASGPDHIGYLTQIAPLDIAVELLVGQAHLGGFGSVEVLAKSKQELVEGLLPSGVAVLNLDDPRVAAMSEVAPGEVVFFSAVGNKDADLWAESVVVDEGGRPSFRLCWPEQPAGIPIQLRLSGAHQVANALAAAGAALATGMSVQEVARELGQIYAASPHRMDVRKDVEWEGAQNLTVIDDSYNANPDSLASGLRAARHIAGTGRLVAVIGEMLELGEASEELHAQAGRYVKDAAPAALIGVGEGAATILEVAGLESSELAADAERATSLLPHMIESGDTVFLKGSYGSGVWQVADALLLGQDDTK